MRETPAAESERQAVYGLDPDSLSKLAVKDAQEAAALNPQLILAYQLQVNFTFGA